MVTEADWLTWAFWTGNTQGLRDLALIVAALVGLPFVIWRTIATHLQSKAALRQAKTASERHEQQTEADRQRRITESFAQAIEQFGHKKLEVRLGAIYALERIARESSTDHWPIMETLTAYVRSGTSLPRDDRQVEQLEMMLMQEEAPVAPSADVQAALNVIGRRRRDHDPDRLHLDLSHTNLSGVELREAHLENAILSHALLFNARLVNVFLDGADLAGAHLDGANLQFARLTRASLERAHLGGANLQGATLDTVILRDATLSGACLVDADLRGAVGLTQQQLNQAYGDPATTKLPEGMTVPSYRSR